MSTFGKSTFSAAAYAAARPTYPASLYNRIMRFHGNGPRRKLLDLGCGHGVVSRAMSAYFDSVVGLDVAANMVEQASLMTHDSKISFSQGHAEDLSWLADGSIDMVVSGQAAHWFDFTKAWPELARVIPSGGTLAFWGYRDPLFIGHPRASFLLDHFLYGGDNVVAPGLEGMGAYWEQPGRDRVRRLMRDQEPPASDWQDVQRIEHDIQLTTEQDAGGETLDGAWLKLRIRLGEMEAYLRTHSAYQGWKDAHTEIKSKDQGGEPGDIIDVLMSRIVDSEAEWKALGQGWPEAEVKVVWGSYILMARRR
ncbi:hypothetical protein CDD82_4610 [Ophiocordyceps australis]|uniref:Methyltransferase type 11 domain-containing protein n=1 Tax=Ophiocordyceps australis TaxID=1399860 RepID=A0A2C5Z5F1_9HYPO|nr:hypothetical protein CDD82_4610 [Ophiocordyceps australis]